MGTAKSKPYQPHTNFGKPIAPFAALYSRLLDVLHTGRSECLCSIEPSSQPLSERRHDRQHSQRAD